MWTSGLSEHEFIRFQWGVVIAASLLAAVWDLRTRRIPNWLTFPLLATGFVWAGWIGGPEGLADGASACVVLALPYVLLFFFAGGGAGDAKLMGAIGAWLGLANGVVVLAAVSLSGVAMGIVFALAKGRLRPVLANSAKAAGSLVSIVATPRSRRGAPIAMPQTENMQTMPYGIGVFLGVAISAGGLLAWTA